MATTRLAGVYTYPAFLQPGPLADPTVPADVRMAAPRWHAKKSPAHLP